MTILFMLYSILFHCIAWRTLTPYYCWAISNYANHSRDPESWQTLWALKSERNTYSKFKNDWGTLVPDASTNLLCMISRMKCVIFFLLEQEVDNVTKVECPDIFFLFFYFGYSWRTGWWQSKAWRGSDQRNAYHGFAVASRHGFRCEIGPIIGSARVGRATVCSSLFQFGWWAYSQWFAMWVTEENILGRFGRLRHESFPLPAPGDIAV